MSIITKIIKAKQNLHNVGAKEPFQCILARSDLQKLFNTTKSVKSNIPVSNSLNTFLAMEFKVMDVPKSYVVSVDKKHKSII